MEASYVYGDLVAAGLVRQDGDGSTTAGGDRDGLQDLQFAAGHLDLHDGRIEAGHREGTAVGPVAWAEVASSAAAIAAEVPATTNRRIMTVLPSVNVIATFLAGGERSLAPNRTPAQQRDLRRGLSLSGRAMLQRGGFFVASVCGPSEVLLMSLMSPESWAEKIFVDAWTSGSGGVRAVIEPATGDSLGTVGLASPDDVVRASARAAAAQREWAVVAPAERAAVLRRAGELFEQYADEIQDWLIREAGSIQPKAAVETHIAAQECFEAAAFPTHPMGHVLPSDEPHWSFSRRRPPVSSRSSLRSTSR